MCLYEYVLKIFYYQNKQEIQVDLYLVVRKIRLINYYIFQCEFVWLVFKGYVKIFCLVYKVYYSYIFVEQMLGIEFRVLFILYK